MPRSRSLAAVGYRIAFLVFLVDQLTKLWIIQSVRLQDVGQVPVLPVFALTWVENRNVSMGLLSGIGLGPWGFVALTGAIAVAVAVWLHRETSRPDVIALGFVLGGAFGNILDRIRFGYVVDFLHFFWGTHDFYVFNVADAAITVGVILLLLRSTFARTRTATESK